MSRAIFHRLAERELREAVDYYDERSPGLGGELLTEIRQATLLLSRHPKLAPRTHGRLRGFILPRFPYTILYRPLANGDLRILAIAHHKRRPKYWIDRR